MLNAMRVFLDVLLRSSNFKFEIVAGLKVAVWLLGVFSALPSFLAVSIATRWGSLNNSSEKVSSVGAPPTRGLLGT